MECHGKLYWMNLSVDAFASRYHQLIPATTLWSSTLGKYLSHTHTCFCYRI